MMRRAALLASLLLLAFAGTALAHTRSQSFSTWTVADRTVRGVFQVDAYRATQLTEEPQDLNRLLHDHLARTIAVTQAGAPCLLKQERALTAGRGDLRVELEFECPKVFDAEPAQLKIGAFFDVSVSHVHYVRIAGPGERVSEAVLTQGRAEVALGGAGEAHVSGFFQFLTLGFEHVLSGVDHIAFLIALAMLAGGPWRIVIAVTGFTLGHSLTLALVALNVLRPESSAVEALIGFTVAWAAGDALARRRNLPGAYGLAGAAAILLLPLVAWAAGLPSLSWLVFAGVALFAAAMSFGRKIDAPLLAPAIATVFGLAHGAGFAGPLLELHIPSDSLVLTLLAFNLGVEAGQLTALAVLGAVIWTARTALKQIPEPAFDVAGATLFALGTFWFVSRALA
jgi:hypothetical protein